MPSGKPLASIRLPPSTSIIGSMPPGTDPEKASEFLRGAEPAAISPAVVAGGSVAAATDEAATPARPRGPRAKATTGGGIELPRRRRSAVVDRAGNERQRMTFYLSPDTAKRVHMVAAARGCELSDVGELALVRLLDEMGEP